MTKSKSIKWLSVFMAALMVFSIFSVVTAFADEEDEDSELGYFKKSVYTVKAGSWVEPEFVSGGHLPECWRSSNPKIAKLITDEAGDCDGKVYGLKKGTVTITMWDTNSAQYTCKVKVTTNPKLSKKSITVKKGKKVTVKIIGKSPVVKNVYKNTKIAKVVSKKTAKKIKVKGLKKGKTTLKIKVNGLTLRLK